MRVIGVQVFTELLFLRQLRAGGGEGVSFGAILAFAQSENSQYLISRMCGMQVRACLD